jgi:chromosomal replication initiator protein
MEMENKTSRAVSSLESESKGIIANRLNGKIEPGESNLTSETSTCAEELWAKILDSLAIELNNKQAFMTWLAPTKAVKYENGTLVVSVPNGFFIEWIEQYYRPIIEETIRKIVQEPIKVKLQANESKTIGILEANTKSGVGIRPDASKLQARYTFDNFIVGESNRLAYAACRAVAETPAKTYNPLFIYGGVGLGKTHLLQAIGNHAKKVNSNLKIYYIPAENLFIELIQAIERGNTISFKDKYRSQDILLIDDIHYLIGKERLQEEIFHIFNYLHSAARQIVFTSDRPPYEIPTIEDRLASRLQQGLVVDIQPPDIETRIAILRKKAEAEGFELRQEIAYLIATRVRTNIRILEGCLIRLMAIQSIEAKPLTIEQVERAISALIPNTNNITPETITEKTAEEFKITINQIKGQSRTKTQTQARQVAMYLMRKHLGLSLKEIGLYFGKKDHTTVLHAIKKVEDMRTLDQEFASLLNRITMRINRA